MNGKASIFTTASWSGSTKPISLFCTCASTSIGPSLGTTTISGWPAVTTCPSVVTASCCTVPEIGALSVVRSRLSCALTTSCTSVSRFCAASVSAWYWRATVSLVSCVIRRCSEVAAALASLSWPRS
ncbi:hypothetical protein FF100_36615 [Methylobacterium terricola]|uniref:Uncharacterized protein n=1 Tax=Methylobacterium terricola TaxID=2583531 RepID=A0A5C4L5L6_9HYPH|nr:hypothetical protein FF100_36615 [Methylobacterium terricola]